MSSAPMFEARSIEQIPDHERHGRPLSLLTLWFASNFQINGLVTGAIAIAVGLSVPQALLALVIGNLLGGLFMAYHSAQGPKLGLAQMIQSRAQFGFVGAIVPYAVVVIMYLGFAVAGGLVAGPAIASALGTTRDVGIVVYNVVVLAVAVFGYRLIHAISRAISLLSLVAFVVIAVAVLGRLHLHAAPSAGAGAFLLAVSIAASWQITWAPYVSDYSRYLPASTRTSTTVAFTYVGSAIGGALIMAIGALAAALNANAVNANPIGFLAGQVSPIHEALVALLLLSLVPASAESPYGAFLTALAAVTPRGLVSSTRTARTIFVVAFTVVSLVLTLALPATILTDFENVILFLLYLLVPWTAINLTDYYLVRRGRYDVAGILDANGPYGRLQAGPLAIYVVTILVELPFVNSALYEGPIARALDGADISWIVGLVVATIAYLAWARARGLLVARAPGTAPA
ncbi:permease for cytosine/purines uracil thiamine allantoin [Acidimicrobium ferrooxidans DSM 10331]|uniref:Permease for cytosine/purines uracil thiamine allantoin n=1 Tax=Acidimicrobium ferrooxidans (strain DSM 10331 / JCM 15462 / NBRC 103882 / ICP) TaxID=525909 RepID=C7M026_ACIFD|nr:cytosine permease [Acidimicrobium ferrooxidans]ACU54334.1 permease for cytosine/purines uracil thiamine allantoin [Acidimicrobium ferrooxidans DSM 10331]